MSRRARNGALSVRQAACWRRTCHCFRAASNFPVALCIDVPVLIRGQRLREARAPLRRLAAPLRPRVGAALRDEIAETVADPGDVDDEVRQSLGVLAEWVPRVTSHGQSVFPSEWATR